MESSNKKLQDKNVEIVLGNLLRTGVLISTVFVLAGAIIFLAKHGYEVPHYITFHKKTFHLPDVKDFWNELTSFHGLAIIELGIICLVATPVLRVAFSIFAFLIEKDYLYVAFTIIVLLILMYSLFV